MTKPNANDHRKNAETPPVKPWCFRVARTSAKKYGARENWPSERREALTQRRREKRAETGDPRIEKLQLIAESKMGGIEGRIARWKLRVLKMQEHRSAEEMRRKIVEKIERVRAQRLRAER
jgi:hypothetical protein